MQHTDAEEFARARLAYVSAGRRALSAPRRALDEPAQGSLSRLPPRNEERSRTKGPQTDPPASPLPDPGVLLPRATPRLTVKHLVVVAVLLLCGVGVAVAALGRSAATEIPVAPVTVSQEPPPPSSPPPPVMVRVHVTGAVMSPGVVSLPEGSIVQDALLAAGGLADGADPAHLNLAAGVSDGMQIIVGTVDQPVGDIVEAEPAPTAGAGGGGPGQVNLNSASQQELESLPGIGPVTARAIIEWREQNGNFSTVEELQEISGIGPKTFQKLQPHVTL